MPDTKQFDFGNPSLLGSALDQPGSDDDTQPLERGARSHENGANPFSPMEAAVMAYLQAGCTTVSRITLALGVWSPAVRQALQGLSERDCAVKQGRGAWRPTARGARLRLAPADPAQLPLITRGRWQPRQPFSAEYMLRHLDRPRYGTELARRLGVTRQQIRNNVERLHAEGRLRVADPDEPTFLVASVAESSVLLTRIEERVLSALPPAAYVTAGRVRGVCSSSSDEVQSVLERLDRYGLVSQTRRKWRRRLTTVYQITDAGRQHGQRRDDCRQAHPIPPYPSRRIYSVLRYVATNEPTKARKVAEALGTPRHSTNALFQYFKRQGLAYREGRQQHHGYRLTEHGRRILSELDVFWELTGAEKVGGDSRLLACPTLVPGNLPANLEHRSIGQQRGVG